MALSAKTLAEMRAGALALAAHANKDGIDPAYMDAMIKTQQRAAFLRSLAQERKITIEKTPRPRSNDKTYGPPEQIVVYVGGEMFTDEIALMSGSWPSEALVAQVALAVAAGVGAKPRDEQNGNLPPR